MRMIRWLGSYRFAILLLVCVLLFVITGTIIEEKSGSHSLAASWVYESPLFLALLAGFFVNILLSALLRYPFRVRHLPFLMTHLGLLMILSGVFVKTLFGTQGALFLKEGTASNSLLLSKSYALHLESKEMRYSFPLKEGEVQTLTDAPFPLKVLAWYPHGEERFDRWFQNDQLLIAGLPPLEVLKTNTFPPHPTFRGEIDIYAIEHNDPKSLLQSFHPARPTLIAAQLPSGDEWLSFFSPNQEPIEATFPQSGAHPLVLFDGGFGGYGVTFADFYSKIHRRLVSIESLPKKEERRPILRVLAGSEVVDLLYDPNHQALMWPCMEGHYLIRFGSQILTLPEMVRMREARALAYPESDEPFSYECAIRLDEGEEKWISMNRVHESKSGHRFYLSQLTERAGQARQVQLIVNRDPAKRFLVTPGGIILALGIFGVFWWKKRSSSSSSSPPSSSERTKS